MGKERKGRFGDKVERLQFPFGDNNTVATLMQSDLPTRADLIGYRPPIHYLAETLIGYINNPKEFQKRELRQSRAILLYGPPGTGKTSFGRMVHRETAGRSVYSTVNLATIKKDGDGSAEEKVNALFIDIGNRATALARDKKKTLIVHFDEIETLISNRDTLDHDRQQVVNAFNIAIGDLLDQHANVVIIATTNRQHAIDDASLRRFDQYSVELPNTEGRAQTFAHYMYMAIHANKDRNRDLFDPELVKIIDTYRDAAKKAGRSDSQATRRHVADAYFALYGLFQRCAETSEGFSQDDIRHAVQDAVNDYVHDSSIRRVNRRNRLDDAYLLERVRQRRNTELVRRSRQMIQQGGSGGLRTAA